MLASRSTEQGPGPIGRQLGVDEGRLQLGDLRLLRLEVGFERTTLQLIKQIAGLDLRTFHEVSLLKKGRDARDDATTDTWSMSGCPARTLSISPGSMR